MKLETGKTYLTRNGRQVKVFKKQVGPVNQYPYHGIIDKFPHTWTESGRWGLIEGRQEDLDIVYECKEEPSTAQEGNPGVRKFDTGSVRDSNAGKPRVADLEPYTRLRFGYHMLIGADKYGAKNYLLGQPDDSNFESIHRHLALLELGDTSEDHASAVIFSIQNVILNQQRAGVAVNHFYEQHKKNQNETK